MAEVVGYTHTQGASAALWTVVHNLGRYPYTVRIKSTGGEEVLANVLDTSLNQCLIYFAQPQTGTAEVL